jgi:hypothetical protein
MSETSKNFQVVEVRKRWVLEIRRNRNVNLREKDGVLDILECGIREPTG